MNQKLLFELDQDLKKQPDPFCNLEEVVGLYRFTCLLDENIANIEVADNATPAQIEELLSTYLKDRNIERTESIDRLVIYPDLELEGANLEHLEHIDNQDAFDLLAKLVSLYSSQCINTICYTEHVRDYREEELEMGDEDDLENQEICQAIVNSANAILKTKTAMAVGKHWGTPLASLICSMRKELSLHNKQIPAFLETYVSDALDTFEKCTGKRFQSVAGEDTYYDESHSPLYYNVFFLYPQDPADKYSHEHIIAEIDESINCDLQEHLGGLEVWQEQYNDLQFFVDAVGEYKEVVTNFNYIVEALR